MITQIYLSSNSSKTAYLVQNVRGVINSERIDANINGSTKELVRVEYETSDVDLNTIIKYYLKSLDESSVACVYYSDNLYLRKNKYNVELKQIKKITITSKVNDVSCDIDLIEKIDRYDRYDKPLTKAFPNRINFLLLLLLGMGLVFLNELVYLLPMFSLTQASLDTDLNEVLTSYNGFISLASKLLATALIFIFFDSILKFDFKVFKKRWLKYLIIVLIGFGLIYFDGLLFDNVIYKALKINTEAKNEQSILDVLQGKSGIPYAICIALFTPFVEEMVFRKFAFSALKYFKLPKWLTIILTGVLFAIIHCFSEDFTTLASWVFFIQYFSLSLIITLVYSYTNENIYASTLAHILNNVLGILMIL